MKFFLMLLVSVLSVPTFSQENQYVQMGSAILTFDTNLKLNFSGFVPNQQYEIKSFRRHSVDKSRVYSLTTQVTADSNGRLYFGENALKTELARELTVSEKSTADYVSMGLLDELKHPVDTETQKIINDLQTGSDRILFQVKSSDGAVKFFSQEFLSTSPDVIVESIDANLHKVDGKVYRNKNSSGKGPTIVLWGGSGGTYSTHWAQFLAHQGFNVVAIRYFSYDPNDPSVKNGAINYLINRLPLEIFERAILFAKKQTFSDPSRISVMGESRGGESALLIAKYLGNDLGIETVIANRPLAVSVGSKINGAAYNDSEEKSSWSFRGQDIPFAGFVDKESLHIPSAWELTEKFEGPLKFIKVKGLEIPIIRLLHVFQNKLGVNNNEAKIDVSQYRGRILTIAGDKDPMWPAAEAVQEIARQRVHFSKDVHVIVRGAGHVTAPGLGPDSMGPNYLSINLANVTAEKIAQKQVGAVLAGGSTRLADAIYSLENAESVVSTLKGLPKKSNYIEYNQRAKFHQKFSCESVF